MNATLYPLCGLVAWIIVLSGAGHLPAMRRQPARLATWAMFLFFAVTFTMLWSAVWDSMDRWTGLAESNTLISQCCVVCFSVSALSLLQLWSYEPGKARRRVRATVAVGCLTLAAMLVLFLRSDAEHQHDQAFARWYGGSAQYVAYLIVYLAVGTAATEEILRLCRRYARVTARSWLRSGLVTAALGAAVGLLYDVTRLADVVAAQFDFDLGSLEDVAEVGAGLGGLLVMTGLTMNRWGPRLSAAAARVRRIAAYPRLRTLWDALQDWNPGIAFDADRGQLGRWRRARRILRDPEFHVARRVVEIRDGILALHPYLDPHTAEHVRARYERLGLHGEDLAAAVEAARIRIALDTSGTRPRQAPAPGCAALLNNAPADLDAEITWLLKVTRHFAQCPPCVQDTAATPEHSVGESP